MNSLPGLAVALIYLTVLVGTTWLVVAGRHTTRQRATRTEEYL